jgi:hypothetical protein
MTMDAGLKSARITSLTIVLGLALGPITIGILQHHGYLPENKVVSAPMPRKPGIVALEESFKRFDVPPEKEAWKGQFTVARVEPDYVNGQQRVIVLSRGGPAFGLFGVLAPASEHFMVGDQVEFGSIRYVFNSGGNFTDNQFYIAHLKN